MRITESQLRRIIREVIKEAAFADEKEKFSAEKIHRDASFPSGSSLSPEEQERIDLEAAKELERQHRARIEDEFQGDPYGPNHYSGSEYYSGSKFYRR